LLMPGVGEFKFDYAVRQGTVSFVVERIFQSGAPTVELKKITETAPAGTWATSAFKLCYTICLCGGRRLGANQDGQ